jgi:CDP-glucose 4,6-dehydratase
MTKLFKDIFRKKKILITGDTGFKGSWLAIWLLELGADVYGYALPPKTANDNFVVTELNKKIKHIDGDIRDLDSLTKFFNSVNPEFAFHLAAQPLVLESYANPHYTFETNLMGTINFFEALRNSKSVKVALNITSDKCYKNNDWVWGYRENDPMGGKDPYSASKGCSELITDSYINSFFNNSECNIASVRAGNVIGAGDWAENRIVPDYFRAMRTNKKLEVRNPNATRPWQHVLEPLSGYLFLASKLFENKKYCGGWNFGPKDSMNYTVQELLNEIQKVENSVKIILNNDRNTPHEANFLKLDISKAQRFLNWTPILNFNETITMTVDGYKIDILKGQNLFQARLEQIYSYYNKAKNSGAPWII